MIEPSLSLVPVTPADEFLHLDEVPDHHHAIETNLFGFNVPDERIEGQVYLSYRPFFGNMKVSIFAFQGIKRHQLSAEYFNEYTLVPMLKDNGCYDVQMGSCRLSLRVVEPLRHIEIAITDHDRGFALELSTDAVMPPAGRPGGKHFTQLMHNSGSLTLRGKRYDVDGYYVRDRSWSQTRGEDICPGPPVNWMVGWFGPDQAFQASILDTSILEAPEYGPDWADHIEPSEVLGSLRWESGGPTTNATLRGGWWYDGVETRPINHFRNQTSLFPGTLVPQGIEIEIGDTSGGRHRISGKTIAMMPKMLDQNLVNLCCFTEWTMSDATGYGEVYVVYDNEHLYKLGGDAAQMPQLRGIF